MSSTSHFQLRQINTAPEFSGLKSWEVSIRLGFHSKDKDGGIQLGAPCYSQADLDDQVSFLIRELKSLRFPTL